MNTFSSEVFWVLSWLNQHRLGMGTDGRARRAWTGPLTFGPPSASASFSSAPCASPRPSTPPSASWARRRRRRARWCPPPARRCAFRGPLLVPCLSLGAWRVLWRPVAGCAGVSAVVWMAKCSSRGGSWTTSVLWSPPPCSVLWLRLFSLSFLPSSVSCFGCCCFAQRHAHKRSAHHRVDQKTWSG